MHFLPPALSRQLWRLRAGRTLARLGIRPSQAATLFREADADLRPVLAEVNERIRAEASTGPAGQMPFDIGVEVLYVLTRAAAPSVVVETGVSAGMSSAVWLAAMRRNGVGRLHSIDLPKLSVDDGVPGGSLIPPGRTSGWAIPDELRERHDLRLGPSRELLPALLEEVGEVDVFFHDSDHSDENMRFEYESVWPVLRPGGFLVSHDVHRTPAFDRFAGEHGAPHGRVLITGVARKPRVAAPGEG